MQYFFVGIISTLIVSFITYCISVFILGSKLQKKQIPMPDKVNAQYIVSLEYAIPRFFMWNKLLTDARLAEYRKGVKFIQIVALLFYISFICLLLVLILY